MNASNSSIKESSKKVWGSSPAGWTFGESHEPGTRAFFEAVIAKRFSHEVPWLDSIVEFKRFAGKAVLEIGSGCGYDAYQFCKAGALYTGIDITPENPIAAKKHLEYYGYQAVLLEMDVEQMSFADTFDYIYSFGVLHHTPDIKKALENCFNALKKDGELQVIVYNKWSIFYILTTVLHGWIFKRGFLKRTLAEQRSLIEYTESSARPLVNVYSKRELKKLVEGCGFKIINCEIRKLVPEDLPMIRFIWRFYKYLPQTVLNYIGRYFGWYLSIRAIKN